MGATASVEAPAAEELKRLFDKHDVTGSGNLERQEAYALIEDLRLRYGMEEELPDSFKEAVFEDFDKDHAGTWSWSGPQGPGGECVFSLGKGLTTRARQVSVSGAGAAVAAMKEVEKVKDLEEEIELDFHPMRIENISIGQESWTFAPQIDLRVIRGDPRRGRAAPHEVNEAVFKGRGAHMRNASGIEGSTRDHTGREPRARELSSTTARQNEAFAERFSALPPASAPAVPSASSGSVRRSSVKFETKTPQEVEQISQRLAQVRRCHLDFLSGDGSREVLKAKEVSSPVRSARTRSQRLQQDFEDIDAGKLDAKSVFSKVVGADNRVNTKLLFFRDRLDLVLPAIEDRFLVHDSQRDCYTVDVLRLRAHHSQDDSRHEPSADLLEESLGPHHMSLDLSAASSWSQQAQDWEPLSSP
ncbi:unnamed protein product [Effrenium voratum]|nr:unnamed protein product [Effrenium voratum]